MSAPLVKKDTVKARCPPMVLNDIDGTAIGGAWLMEEQIDPHTSQWPSTKLRRNEWWKDMANSGENAFVPKTGLGMLQAYLTHRSCSNAGHVSTNSRIETPTS